MFVLLASVIFTRSKKIFSNGYRKFNVFQYFDQVIDEMGATLTSDTHNFRFTGVLEIYTTARSAFTTSEIKFFVFDPFEGSLPQIYTRWVIISVLSLMANHTNLYATTITHRQKFPDATHQLSLVHSRTVNFGL